MRILAIDPGSERSAYVVYDTDSRLPRWWGKLENEDIVARVHPGAGDLLAIEMMASYGMPVGAEVFETCVWAGRFIQRWLSSVNVPEPRRIFRRDVKLHLCGSPRAKDTNVRHALIDRYGPGRDRAVGKKASPGPLYGMKADCWAALAVAITATEAHAMGP